MPFTTISNEGYKCFGFGQWCDLVRAGLKSLDLEKVKQARVDEIGYVHNPLYMCICSTRFNVDHWPHHTVIIFKSPFCGAWSILAILGLLASISGLYLSRPHKKHGTHIL